jgi:predicted ATP-dependent endonuclease of OLD family
VHNNDSVIQIIETHDKNLEKLNVQGKIRSSAEALLANRIIICEGQTEEGLARGLDNFWAEQGGVTFSFQGISTLCANGASNIKALAIGLKSLYYDIAVIVDGDAQNKFSNQDAIELDKLGIEVIMWDNELAIEQRTMIDLPWESVLNSVALAKNEMNIPIRDHVCSKLNQALDDNIEHWVESVELRKAIGSAAKSSDWFKSISKGERWAEIIAPVINSGTINGTDLMIKINKLKQWVEHA